MIAGAMPISRTLEVERVAAAATPQLPEPVQYQRPASPLRDGVEATDANPLQDNATAGGIEASSTATPGSAEAPSNEPSPPAPVIQVGDAHFWLPAPALAVQRVGELWRPGATMVVITTEHYGTPLFCPNGDIRDGLINLAPSREGSQQLVPLYWQNIEEIPPLQDNADGGAGFVDVPPTLSLMAAGRRKRKPLAIERGLGGRLSRAGSVLPTHLEEEEEDEDDEGEEAKKTDAQANA